MTGGERDKANQLIFEVRHPDKPPDYDPQKAAESMVDLLAAAMEEIRYWEVTTDNCKRCRRWRP